MFFETILGLKINLEKKTDTIFFFFFGAVGGDANVEKSRMELGCEVEELPSSYLGHKRLSMWKKPYISKEGRFTLIFFFFFDE